MTWQPPTQDERDGMMRVALEVLHEIKSGERGDRTHCEHGTYTGTWCGPDYLCGPCEDGLSPYEYALAAAWGWLRSTRERQVRETFAAICDAVNDRTVSWEYAFPVLLHTLDGHR